MLKKTFIITIGLLLAIPVFALAGEGSDTIGECQLLPQLRYSYTDNNFDPSGSIMGFSADLFDVGEYASHSAYIQLDYGITNDLDVYALIGVNFIDSVTGRFTSGLAAPINHSFKPDYDPGLLWGVGVRRTICRSKNGFYFGAGIHFTHILANMDYKYYQNNALVDWGHGDLNEYNLYGDFHIGWHFKQIGLTPYIGVEYRQVWAELNLESSPLPNRYSINLENHHPVGPYVGFDYYINNKLYINAEGHMVDRWGVGFGIGYLFDICPKPAPVAPAPELPETSPAITPMK